VTKKIVLILKNASLKYLNLFIQLQLLSYKRSQIRWMQLNFATLLTLKIVLIP